MSAGEKSFNELAGLSWGLPRAGALVANVELERDQLVGEWKEAMSKGRLDRREADYRLEHIEAIVADLRQEFAGGPGSSVPAMYANKCRWIRQELEARREGYPAKVRKGLMSEADLRQRIATFEQLHGLYWKRMFRWEPTGAGKDYLDALRLTDPTDQAGMSKLRSSEAAASYLAQVRAHVAAIDAEDGEQGRLVA